MFRGLSCCLSTPGHLLCLPTTDLPSGPLTSTLLCPTLVSMSNNDQPFSWIFLQTLYLGEIPFSTSIVSPLSFSHVENPSTRWNHVPFGVCPQSLTSTWRPAWPACTDSFLVPLFPLGYIVVRPVTDLLLSSPMGMVPPVVPPKSTSECF